METKIEVDAMPTIIQAKNLDAWKEKYAGKGKTVAVVATEGGRFLTLGNLADKTPPTILKEGEIGIHIIG